jgi:hypothetical protein
VLKRLVTASPARIALLTQAHQLHPHPDRPTDLSTPGDDLLDQQLPLLGLVLRSGGYYSPGTLTDAETAYLLFTTIPALLLLQVGMCGHF